jgi:hypothetical protein
MVESLLTKVRWLIRVYHIGKDKDGTRETVPHKTKHAGAVLQFYFQLFGTSGLSLL